MLNPLIVTKTDLLMNTSSYDIITLNEKLWKKGQILFFTPNRQIQGDGDMSICFIPFSHNKSWEYKNNARTMRYKLGEDNCLIIDTDITYKIHKKINLSYTEEVHILLLAIEFLILEGFIPTISHRLDIGENQNEYLEELIKAGSVKVLYD